MHLQNRTPVSCQRIEHILADVVIRRYHNGNMAHILCVCVRNLEVINMLQRIQCTPNQFLVALYFQRQFIGLVDMGRNILLSLSSYLH